MSPLVGPTRRVILHVRDTIRTALNSFGTFREYPYRPSFDPDASVPTEDLADFDCLAGDPSSCPPAESENAPPWPFTNMTTWRFMRWMYTGSSTKSEGEATRLVGDVFQAVDFDPHDLAAINIQREKQRLDKAGSYPPPHDEAAMSESSPPMPRPADEPATHGGDGWREASVEIEIPTGSKDGPAPRTQRFVVPGLRHRSLIEIVKSAFVEPIARRFHLFPFRHFWKSSLTGKVERLYDELYTSDAWIKAHDDLQKVQRSDGCKLERVIAGMMLWSDATHLAQFGEAKAWPVYVFFGNLSKYVRWRTSPLSCHHVAYIIRKNVSYFRGLK
ncbi:uncharacterized protein C8Q71DRAFT_719102 [Rhodofomes roseus]|uniref:Uncharacterized protein n=1 Tax=Rhodofomes roseus TaxID=34475 RepID=A0ABQ8JXB2_9APHY|nr:uncharacterized protein C8Q71DRAFT_719102 [Rhodofomes roseus]KAH9828720.1 hypothetical protein C8Q71DRAFT_719102 [Rhodofomes roseus]